MKAFATAAVGLALGMALAAGCRLDGSWKNRRLTGTCEGARIVSSTISSVHGPPGVGAVVDVAGFRRTSGSGVPGAVSGVRTDASDGSTRSSAGVGTGRLEVTAPAPVEPSPGGSSHRTASQPPPASRATSTASRISRRRQ